MEHYPFSARPLPYPDGALEPYLSETIISRHVSAHFQVYVDRLNATLETYPLYHQWSLERLLSSVPLLPQAIRDSVKVNGGGVYNHKLYFYGMAPSADYRPPRGALMQAIQRSFRTFENFQTQFLSVTSNLYGDGYTWLTADPYERGGVPLRLINSSGQDTPLARGLVPLLVVDLWRHAYELDYGMRREEYVRGWFALIRWAVAEERYRQAMNLPPEEGETDTAPAQTVQAPVSVSREASPVQEVPAQPSSVQTDAVSPESPSTQEVSSATAEEEPMMATWTQQESSQPQPQEESSMETVTDSFSPQEEMTASSGFFDPILQDDALDDSPQVATSVPAQETATAVASSADSDLQAVDTMAQMDMEEEQIPYLLRNENYGDLPDLAARTTGEEVPTLLQEEVPGFRNPSSPLGARTHSGRNPAAWSQRNGAVASGYPGPSAPNLSASTGLPGVRPRATADLPFFRSGDSSSTD